MSRLQSAFADELGVEHPILLAGMAVVASPRLAAAVSNAGGLGVIGAGFPNPSPRRLSKMLDELGRSELAGEPTPPRGITLL
jgi:NAD(P)H-dependent flavin oxidoreductase YrpB (nitropropane dioxygenase family)